jgi:electron transport complex protein RnfG
MLAAMKKNGATLALFACASTGLVAVTNHLTADTIAQQQRDQLKRQLNQVLPHEMHDNELYAACTLLSSPEMLGSGISPAYIATKDGQPSGIAIEATAPDGYNGAIQILVGMDVDGVVTGTRVLAHNETPGLGDKIDTRISDWVLAFTGKSVNDENLSDWQVKKDGGQFDQFTGATITPRAVVKAVKNSVIYYQQHKAQIIAQPFNCGEDHE